MKPKRQLHGYGEDTDEVEPDEVSVKYDDDEKEQDNQSDDEADTVKNSEADDADESPDA